MRYIIEIILAIALFAATGALIHAAARARFTPAPKTEGADIYIIIAAKGAAAGLEQTVLSLKYLDETARLGSKIVIYDRGLDDTGLRVASMIARDETTALCNENELAHLINT